MRYSVIFCLATVILVLLSGCDNSDLKSISEGEIHYNIIFHDRNAVLPAELMPNTMVVKFKDDRTVMEITSPIGNNGVFIITEPDKNQIQTFLRVLGMKYYYEGSADELPPGIDPMKTMNIRDTSQETNILNMKCRKAIVNVPDKDFTYDIWYTRDLNIEKPNSANPFKEIDGVLLNFFFMMGDVMVEFEAEGIYQRPVPEKDFEQSGDFRRIDRKSMDNLITGMMSL